jgi:DNA-binding protein
MAKENVVYIGRKPIMTYVMVVVNVFAQKNFDEILLRARGRAISSAVDVAEVTKRLFVKDLEFGIEIGTEQLPTEDGETRNVSTMEIALIKSPTGEVGKEENKVPAVKQEPAPPWEPDEPATVKETAPEEALAPPPEEEKLSESKVEDEAPEEEKR